jgi:hypothetical protein
MGCLKVPGKQTPSDCSRPSGVPRGADGQREQDHQPGRREAHAQPLGGVLWVGGLVGGGVGHGHRRTIDHLDGAAPPAPRRRGLALHPPAGGAGQPGQHRLGQPFAGLAVGASVSGAGGQSPAGAPGEEAGDGGAARVVGVQHLREEDPEGHQRREEAVAEGDMFVAQGLRDVVVGQGVGEGQAWGLGELLSGLSDLAGAAVGGSRSQGWPPCV